MKKVQVQGVHHITLVGSTRQSALDFWQGALGMPFVFEQPNLGKPDENHLYFDPGDGRLLTVFTNESREDAGRTAPREIGCVEHIAFNVSKATFTQAPARLRERGIDFIERDRGFMNSMPRSRRRAGACRKIARDTLKAMCSTHPISLGACRLASSRDSLVNTVSRRPSPGSKYKWFSSGLPRLGCSMTNGMPSAPCQKSTALCFVDPTMVM